MAEMVKVHLQRSYLWVNEEGNVDSYGPGEVPIPRQMAAGLQREKVDIGLPQTTEEGEVHPKIFAQRESEASERSVKAATVLANRFGLSENEAALKVEESQSDQKQVLRNEAVAGTLEALLEVTPTDVDGFVRQAEEAVGQRLKEAAKQGRDALLAVIEGLPGIGRKSIEAISNALGDDAPTGENATEPFGASPEAQE